MEYTVCHGFSENRPVLFISLPPPSFRPSCFPIQPCLPASRLPSLQPIVHSQGELCKTPTRMRAFLALKRQPALLCPVQDRVQTPRPFITWPRPTFSPTPRISAPVTLNDSLPHNSPQAILSQGDHTFIPLTLSEWKLTMYSFNFYKAISLDLQYYDTREAREWGSEDTRQTHLHKPPTQCKCYKSKYVLEKMFRWGQLADLISKCLRWHIISKF